jgi:hypothetical protein
MIEDEFYTDEKPASLSDYLLGILSLAGIAVIVYLVLQLAAK